MGCVIFCVSLYFREKCGQLVIFTYVFVFTGEYEDGVEEGEGIITYQDGNILEGEFSDGKIHGHAVFKYPNGDKREGFFFENVLDGQVIYTKGGRPIV